MLCCAQLMTVSGNVWEFENRLELRIDASKKTASCNGCGQISR